MIQELELAIRAIVRDELKRAVLVGGATDQASQQRKEKNEYGLRWSGRGLYGTQDAMVAVVAASDRPLSTRDIGSILWDENLGIEMAAFRHALRNAAAGWPRRRRSLRWRTTLKLAAVRRCGGLVFRGALRQACVVRRLFIL